MKSDPVVQRINLCKEQPYLCQFRKVIQDLPLCIAKEPCPKQESYLLIPEDDGK
jgi:hypothetical protein